MIYGGIVVLWLCYLVPLALRRYDDASRSRSVERFSTAMRVLGRTEPAQASQAVVAGRAARAARPGASRTARRSAARAAARRRRRVLGVLLIATGGIAAVCAFGLLAWWVLSVPAALVVVFVVGVRVQVARASRRAADRAAAGRLAADRPVGESLAADPLPPLSADPVRTRTAAADADEAPTEVLDTVGAVDPEPVVATTGGGSLWDPLPITLPTYVFKPRATRTVRTIDLSGPGTWTSGSGAQHEGALPRQPQPVTEAAGGETDGETGAGASGSTRARAVGD